MWCECGADVVHVETPSEYCLGMHAHHPAAPSRQQINEHQLARRTIARTGAHVGYMMHEVNRLRSISASIRKLGTLYVHLYMHICTCLLWSFDNNYDDDYDDDVADGVDDDG